MKKILSILIITVMLVSSLFVLTSCSARGTDGEDGTHGKDGKDGVTPTIGENGNWWFGDVDSGISVKGEKGEKGDPGKKGEEGLPGIDGEDGKPTPTPSFRYNDEAEHYEVSFDDGKTWSMIPNYDPDEVYDEA